MNVRSLLIFLLLMLFAVFSVVNWQALNTPTELSVLVARVEAPLGLLMLGFTAVLTAVFLAYVAFVQMSALSANRKHAEELRRQRELADQAEASRFTELRQYLEQGIAGLREAQAASEGRLREEIADAANSLAAAVGEVDDRMARQFPTTPAQMP